MHEHSHDNIPIDNDFTLENSGHEYSYIIKHQNTVIGRIALTNFDYNCPSMSYIIYPEYYDRDLTSRITRALTQYAFDVIGVQTVSIHTDQDNVEQNSVAVDSGYRYAGSSYINRQYSNIWMKP